MMNVNFNNLFDRLPDDRAPEVTDNQSDLSAANEDSDTALSEPALSAEDVPTDRFSRADRYYDHSDDQRRFGRADEDSN